jgi:hypothetical protein
MDATASKSLREELRHLTMLVDHMHLLRTRRNADLAAAQEVFAKAEATLQESYRLLETVNALDYRQLLKSLA